MKNGEENILVHEAGKYVTELVIKASNGNFSIYQKRLFGDEAVG